MMKKEGIHKMKDKTKGEKKRLNYTIDLLIISISSISSLNF